MFGEVKAAQVQAASQHTVEIKAELVFRVSNSEKLPVLIDDCARPQALLDAQAKELEAIEKQIAAVNVQFAAATDEDKKAARAELDKLVAAKSSAAVPPCRIYPFYC